MTSKQKARRITNIETLDNFELTNNARANASMTTVNQMYERGSIPKVTQSTNILQLLRDGKTKEFDKRFNTLATNENMKQADAAGKTIAK